MKHFSLFFFVSNLVLSSLVFFLVPTDVSAQETSYKRMFLVSAYYSPLPGQTRYIRGTYEADIRLNGRGTNGADGTPVYVGMIAAPKTYAFGTKIEIPELGIGGVHDRGGAIIARENYDRIDVWMGYGDSGLTRALNWGMRLVEGVVHAPESSLAENIDYSWISGKPSQYPSKKKQKKQQQKVTKTLSLGDKSSEVKKLQKSLTDAGFFSGPLSGFFGEQTEQSIKRFQISQEVVLSENAYGAGVFGMKTRKALTKFLEKEEKKHTTVAQKKESTQMAIISGLGKNSTGEEVRILQSMLRNLGLYEKEQNGTYDTDTIAAVLAFQKSESIVTGDFDIGAGYFGKKTSAALKKVMAKKREKQKMFPQTQSGILLGMKTKKMEKSAVFEPQIALADMKQSMILYGGIAKGTKGEQVKDLQKTLVTMGVLEEKYITGYYGSITEKAVLQAQEKVVDVLK